jgi:hypothetical protein
LAIGLTKSLFVHFLPIENSYKSNLEVFNYKNPYKVKPQNFCHVGFEIRKERQKEETSGTLGGATVRIRQEDNNKDWPYIYCAQE